MQQLRHLTRNIVPRGMTGCRQHIQQLVKGFEICRHNNSACSRTTHDEMPIKIKFGQDENDWTERTANMVEEGSRWNKLKAPKLRTVDELAQSTAGIARDRAKFAPRGSVEGTQGHTNAHGTGDAQMLKLHNHLVDVGGGRLAFRGKCQVRDARPELGQLRVITTNARKIS
jgi:hypothetical protein